MKHNKGINFYLGIVLMALGIVALVYAIANNAEPIIFRAGVGIVIGFFMFLHSFRPRIVKQPSESKDSKI